MGRASSLFRLQTVDLQLDQKRARLRQIDDQLRDTSSVDRGRQALTEAEAALGRARLAWRAAEDELAANKSKSDEAEKRMYSGLIHSPKELQDLQAEVESLARFRSTLEDRLLETMLALETTEADHRSAESGLSQAAGDRSLRDSALSDERAQVDAELERLLAEREAALANVTQGDLALYTQVRDNRGGLAVAVIQDDACGACGLTVAHSLRQVVSEGDNLVRCNQCGRILYAG